MQVLSDQRDTGLIRLYVDNDDDLWTLYNVIRPGDRVRGLTHRRDESQQDVIRSQKTDRKPMMLTLRVEKCEYSDFSERLRILGTIIAGPQDHGCHHTINVEKQYRLDIFKDQWRGHEIERLRKAVENAKRPAAVFLSMEDDNALVALLRQFGLEVLVEIAGGVSGKQYRQKDRGKGKFFDEITGVLAEVVDEKTPLIVVGPGFARDEYVKYASKRRPELFGNTVLKATGQAGITGINEALKRGLENLGGTSVEVLAETREVDEMLTEIACDGKVTYGHEHVRRALEFAAVERLLVTDRLMREGAGEGLVRMARETGAGVSHISTAHEAGERLEALGGVAAILRFRVDGLC